MTRANGRGVVFQGLCRLEGDTLTLCCRRASGPPASTPSSRASACRCSTASRRSAMIAASKLAGSFAAPAS